MGAIQKKTDIELMLDWLFICAKVNPRGVNAKILKGEVDYHVLFGTCQNSIEEILGGRKELTDIPGYGGKYKMTKDGDVVSFAQGDPKVLKQLKMDNRGGHKLYVNLTLDGKKKSIQVEKLYEMTFGKPMEG